MTQIGLKLFNKMPFVRNDTGSLSEGGACRETNARGQVVFCQARCMYVRILDDLSKAEPVALGPRPPASLPFFLADHDRVCRRAMSDLTANVARPGIPGLIALVAAIPVLASLRRSLSGAGRRFAAMVHDGGFRFHGAVVARGSSHDPLAGVFRGVARTGQLPAAGLLRTGVCGPVLDRRTAGRLDFKASCPSQSCWPFRFSFITTNAPSAGIGCCSRSWRPVSCSWDCHG